jgi:hypothetical protein
VINLSIASYTSFLLRGLGFTVKRFNEDLTSVSTFSLPWYAYMARNPYEFNMEGELGCCSVGRLSKTRERDLLIEHIGVNYGLKRVK